MWSTACSISGVQPRLQQASRARPAAVWCLDIGRLGKLKTPPWRPPLPLRPALQLTTVSPLDSPTREHAKEAHIHVAQSKLLWLAAQRLAQRGANVTRFSTSSTLWHRPFPSKLPSFIPSPSPYLPSSLLRPGQRTSAAACGLFQQPAHPQQTYASETAAATQPPRVRDASASRPFAPCPFSRHTLSGRARADIAGQCCRVGLCRVARGQSPPRVRAQHAERL